MGAGVAVDLIRTGVEDTKLPQHLRSIDMQKIDLRL